MAALFGAEPMTQAIDAGDQNSFDALVITPAIAAGDLAGFRHDQRAELRASRRRFARVGPELRQHGGALSGPRINLEAL